MMTPDFAGARALAGVHLEWLKSLRDTLSEYHSILMEPAGVPNGDDEAAKTKAKELERADERRLSYLGTQLDLLLDQEKKYQQALWQVSDDILDMDWPRVTDDEIDKADKRFVAAAREVFDFHQQRIEAELLGGTVEEEPPAL